MMTAAQKSQNGAPTHHQTKWTSSRETRSLGAKFSPLQQTGTRTGNSNKQKAKRSTWKLKLTLLLPAAFSKSLPHPHRISTLVSHALSLINPRNQLTTQSQTLPDANCSRSNNATTAPRLMKVWVLRCMCDRCAQVVGRWKRREAAAAMYRVTKSARRAVGRQTQINVQLAVRSSKEGRRGACERCQGRLPYRSVCVRTCMRIKWVGVLYVIRIILV